MLFSVRPGIRQEDFAGIPNIGKGIENMGELLCRKVLRIEVATINSLQVMLNVDLPHLDQPTYPVDKVSNVLVT